MWLKIFGGLIILGTFAWMGFMEMEETGEGWARAGLRYLLWSSVFVGGCVVVLWAWEGLSAA